MTKRLQFESPCTRAIVNNLTRINIVTKKRNVLNNNNLSLLSKFVVKTGRTDSSDTRRETPRETCAAITGTKTATVKCKCTTTVRTRSSGSTRKRPKPSPRLSPKSELLYCNATVQGTGYVPRKFIPFARSITFFQIEFFYFYYYFFYVRNKTILKHTSLL